MSQLAIWTIAAGILSGASCALLGSYLVLRRMSLLGDAISHAVLPGTVIGVLWSGQLAGWQVFTGAVVVGLLTAFLSHALAEMGNVPEDSSMGVVYTSLFALGVILITQFAAQIDLDPGCVLYGQIEYLPLNRFIWMGLEIPWEILPLLFVTLATIAFIAVLWKELKLVAFDAALSTAMGISAFAVHYLLMGMVAVVTVASFKSVGSILVVAMLIVPPATAYMLTDRLWSMQIWAVSCAAVSAVVGFQAASYWNTSVAGMMSVVAGLLFLIAVVFSPSHGLLTKGIRNFQLTLRIVSEDILAVLYRIEERGLRDERSTTLAVEECARFAGGGWWPQIAIPLLKSRGLIQSRTTRQLALTENGRRKAESLVRSHRLWEAYLEKHFELPRDHLHEPASRIEHYLGPDLQQELSQEMGRPVRDPHGQDIPPADKNTL